MHDYEDDNDIDDDDIDDDNDYGDDDIDDDDDQDELGFWSCGRRHLLPATVIFWPSNIQYEIFSPGNTQCDMIYNTTRYTIFQPGNMQYAM